MVYTLQFTFDFRLILILPTIRLIHNFLCLVLISKLAQLPGGGTWVFFGWVCAAWHSKLAPHSRKNFH